MNPVAMLKKLFGRDVSTAEKSAAAVAQIEKQIATASAEREQIVMGEMADGDAAKAVATLDAKIGLLQQRADGLRTKMLDLRIEEMEKLLSEQNAEVTRLSMAKAAARDEFVAEVTKLSPHGRRSDAKRAIEQGDLKSPKLQKITMDRNLAVERANKTGSELRRLKVEKEQRTDAGYRSARAALLAPVAQLESDGRTDDANQRIAQAALLPRQGAFR